MAMAEPHFRALDNDPDEDLPRTFRREKEARAREARERAAQEQAHTPPSLGDPVAHATNGTTASPATAASFQAAPGEAYAEYTDMPYPASVRRFDVPFFHLMWFFIKAVFAAVPALIILGVMLWYGGQMLEAMFPELVRMKILISFPN